MTEAETGGKCNDAEGRAGTKSYGMGDKMGIL